MLLSTLFSDFIKFFNTIKYLRPRQVWFRFLRKIRRPKLSTDLELSTSFNSWNFSAPLIYDQSMFEDGSVLFLSERLFIDNREFWNEPSQSKLWLYNLHYFDDLNSHNFEFRHFLHKRMISRWINENPPFSGNGWEPYTLSLRLVNWIKWLSKQDEIDNSVIISLNQQSNALIQQIEYHILGNHLFSNAKALVFSGCFLKGDDAHRYFRTGLKILKDEISEQFLADGGHFERSPMYHCILLWDLLDLINLATITGRPEFDSVLTQWRSVAQKALNWLTVMCHPDGEVSFFNDSAIGIAASPKQLFDYAESLGFSATPAHTAKLQTLVVSGYSKVTMPQHALLFDHAQVGPDYLPGHAHADTLSFEWSVGFQRVFVNSGTSIYGVSPERLRQRKTAAHNTIVVDDRDSSEVWSGFRVARRANATLRQAVESATEVVIQASHDGYRRLKGKVTHQRTVTVSASQLVVDDMLEGSFTSAVAHFHLHPDIVTQQADQHRLHFTLPSGEQISFFSTGICKLVETTWHPMFGQSIPNQKIEVRLANSTLSTTITLL